MLPVERWDGTPGEEMDLDGSVQNHYLGYRLRGLQKILVSLNH